MAAIGKQVPEKYRSSIFGDAPVDLNRRRSSGAPSINPITGEPLSSPECKQTEDVSDNISVASNGSSGSGEPQVRAKEADSAAGLRSQAGQNAATPTRRVPPGGYTTLQLG